MQVSRNHSLDVLRGLAVAMVIAVHAGQNFTPLVQKTAALATYGHFGVQLFFIVSAYAMMLTFGKQIDRAAVMAFYVRRFFRIAPLFWAAAIVSLLLIGYQPRGWAPEGIGLSDVLLAITFTHWLSPTALNSVVPGGWSIANEMLFYLFFPLLLWIIRSGFLTVCIALIVAIYYFAFALARFYLRDALAAEYPTEHRFLAEGFLFFWLPNQIIAFGWGIVLFQIIELREKPTAALALLLTTAATSFGFAVFLIFLVSYFALSFGVQSRIAEAIGQASYSMYLLHFAVIAAFTSTHLSGHIPLEAAIPLVAAICFAAYLTITGPLIETPSAQFGKRLARQLVDRDNGVRLPRPGE